MRVCHVIEAGGGASEIVFELARFGADAGDYVTVICGSGRASAHFTNLRASMVRFGLVVTSMRREIGLHDIRDAWALYRLLRRFGPFDVIHGHSSKAGALIRIIGPLFPQSIKVYTPHGFITLAPGVSNVYRQIERFLAWMIDVIITVSAVEQNHAVQYLGVNAQKIVLIPNGISLENMVTRAAARRQMGYDNDNFVAGFIGRLAEQKNPIRLFETVAIAAAERPELRLALVSNDSLSAALTASLEAPDLQGKARLFNGYIGRDVIAGFDCLLCSSDYEGFPLIFIEALAAGVPIVTTPVGGSHETVIDGETGFIAEDFSSASLSAALLKMICVSPQERAKYSARARNRACDFGAASMGAATRLCYSRLFERRRVRQRIPSANVAAITVRSEPKAGPDHG